MKTKLMLTAVIAAALALPSLSAPFRGCPPPPPRHHHVAPIHRMHHGHGNFGASFLGGVVGGIVMNTLLTPTVQQPTAVVQTPQPTVVVQNKVWVPEQSVLMGYDRFGKPMYSIIPGHWECR